MTFRNGKGNKRQSDRDEDQHVDHTSDEYLSSDEKAKIVAQRVEEILPVNKLEIRWDDAQQPFVQKRGDAIADEFNWELLNLNHVVVCGPFSNGKYHIIDGQHRVYAIRKVGGLTECAICYVYPVMDKSRAAWLFRELNGKRYKPSALSMFKSGVASGSEPETTINKIAKGVGYSINVSTSPRTISGTRALEYVYRLGGQDHPKLLCNTLVAIRETWGLDEPSATDSVIIRSFGMFIHTYPEANLKRIYANVPKNYTPHRFVGGAKASGEVQRISTTLAGRALLVRMHDHGLRKDRLIDLGRE